MENVFVDTVKRVPCRLVPNDANKILSHVLYKIKVSEDSSLSLKGRIAPHGNEDNFQPDMRFDRWMCPLIGIRVILSIAALKKCCIVKLDVKSAFLQYDPAQGDIYVFLHESLPIAMSFGYD